MVEYLVLLFNNYHSVDDSKRKSLRIAVAELLKSEFCISQLIHKIQTQIIL